jgi:hypothetical protein
MSFTTLHFSCTWNESFSKYVKLRNIQISCHYLTFIYYYSYLWYSYFSFIYKRFIKCSVIFACRRFRCQTLLVEGVAWSAQRILTAVNLGFLDRSRYFFIQLVPQSSSRGWVDRVPDPLLFRKSGRAGNRTQDLWICSQELWSLDHRGGRYSSLADYGHGVNFFLVRFR